MKNTMKDAILLSLQDIIPQNCQGQGWVRQKTEHNPHITPSSERATTETRGKKLREASLWLCNIHNFTNITIWKR